MRRRQPQQRRHLKMSRRLGQNGFGLVAVLLALLIAAALYFGYFQLQSAPGERSKGISAIDAARAVACRSNRQIIERDITLWSVSHPGETPTLAAMQADGVRIPACPEGGRYELVDAEVRCSVHR
jgi:type II secretory pathway component PulJ